MEITKENVPKEIELKIERAIQLKKELEAYEKEIKEQLQDAMEANNIVSIKNDKFTITLAKRTSYKADNIPTEFAKVTLDQSKVATHYKLYGELPESITSSETKYITWRTK